MKILIVNNNMNIGGIQKSLANLLSELSDSEYEIDLMLFCKTGGLLADISENINIIEGNFFTKALGITHAEAKQCGFAEFINRSFWTVLTKIFKTRFTFNILSRLQRLDKSYDCAVSFMHNGDEKTFYGGCAEFVLNSVKAKQKICFIHCDFKNYGGNCEYNRKTLAKFDKIAAVSNSAADVLKQAVPDISDKIMTVHNCCDFKRIPLLANEYTAEYLPDRINLFTAARLHNEKGILRMLPIFCRLKENGLKFIWRIAGDGPDRAEAERLIKEYGLESDIVLLGNLRNPYPYFKSADTVLVPSYNEAAPMVFDEARIFGTPIFTTDTTSAAETVAQTHSGIVCKNTDESIEKTLYKYICGFTPHKNKTSLTDNSAALAEFDDLIKRR